MRILFVDDEPEIWHGLVERNLPGDLRRLGVEDVQLDLASTREEAIHLIEKSKEPHDLIICDGLRVGDAPQFGWHDVREAALRKGPSRFMLFSNDSVVEKDAKRERIPFYDKSGFDLDAYSVQVKRVLDTPLHHTGTKEAPYI